MVSRCRSVRTWPGGTYGRRVTGQRVRQPSVARRTTWRLASVDGAAPVDATIRWRRVPWYAGGTIIVDKVTVPAGDPAAVRLRPELDGAPTSSLADATAPYDSGDLAPGTYSVAETVPAGWDLTSATCSRRQPGQRHRPGGRRDGHLHLHQHQARPHHRRQGHAARRLTRRASPSPRRAPATPDFSLTDAAPRTTSDVVPGTYSVAETVPAGWDLTSAICDRRRDPGTPSTSAPGETVTCTFTNTKRGHIIVDKVTLPGG